MSFKSDLETCKKSYLDLICKYGLCVLSSIEVGAAKIHGKSHTDIRIPLSAIFSVIVYCPFSYLQDEEPNNQILQKKIKHVLTVFTPRRLSFVNNP